MNKLIRLIKSILLFAVSFIVFFIFSKNPVLAYDLTRSGTLTINETWSGTVLVTGDVTVPSGIILTIQPGTVIQFTANSDDQNGGDYPTKAELIVHGVLSAQGTDTQSIVFTSASPTPTPGDWGQIKLDGASPQSIISYSLIEYANTAIRDLSTQMTISNNIIRQNGDPQNYSWGILARWSSSTIVDNLVTTNSNGIDVEDSSTVRGNQVVNNIGWGMWINYDSLASVTYNTIAGNGKDGILFQIGDYASYGGQHPQIHKNIIANNFGYNLANISTHDIDATDNDWGTTDPTQIAKSIYDLNDDLPNYEVLFDPPNSGLVAFTSPSVSAEEHISGNVIWSGTHLVASNIWIDQGSTLVIQAGTQVKFSGFYGIFNHGTLIVQGTPTNPVIFTSNSTTPTPGDWAMIKFDFADSASRIDYAQIKYAYKGVFIYASSPTITNSLISNNKIDGIFARFNAYPRLYQDIIVDNGGNGIIEGANSNSLGINCSTLSGNSGYNLFLVDNISVNATYNYWGTTDASAIVQSIFDRNNVVDYSNYQTSPPTPLQLTAPPDQTASEGTTISFNLGSFTNNCGLENPWSVDVDWGDSSAHTSFNTTNQGTLGNQSHTYIDNGAYTAIVKITGKSGTSDTKTFKVNVANVPPTVGAIIAPTDPVLLNTPINTSANFSDPGILDTHSAVWDWGDGTTSSGTVTEANGSGTVSGTHTYTAPGVYTVGLTVTDKDGGSGQNIYQYVVIFSSTAGFVTGSGTIDSPQGAYPQNPSATGKAILGFSIKYVAGAPVPTGQTKFTLNKRVADFNFTGTDYQWLVITQPKAIFKGTGTVNGSGSYTFLVSIIDGQASGGNGIDTFRIKITDNSNGNVVYDNQMGAADTTDPTTPLTVGSIVIH